MKQTFLLLLLIRFVISDDKEILTDLYTDLGGEFWKAKTNWLEGSDICIWQGVSCVRGMQEAESLDLSSNNLDGSMDILKVLANLKSLKRLNLGQNDFNIDIVNTYEDEIFTNLEELILDDIYLDKVFDDLFKLVQFPELTELSLVGCSISSDFPFFDKVFLPKLVKLDLDDNDFGGFSESYEMDLKNLEFLSVSLNEIEGTLPSYFDQFQNLRFLFLKENYLKGSMDIITKLSKLESLDLSAQLLHHNCSKGYGLTGPVPLFNTQPFLRRISIRENCFTGTIPLTILDGVNLETFEFFQVDTNLLTGSVPAANSFMTLGANKLFLADNKITGIDQKVCENKEFNCNSILCSPGTSHSLGRQASADDPCKPCPEALYYGATRCGAPEYDDDDYFDDDDYLDDDDYDDDFDDDDGSNNDDDSETGKALTTYEILQKLYDYTDGPNWHLLENWITKPDVCDWFGVQCDSTKGLVTGLMLGANNLRGTVPSEIFLLPGLTTLNLNKNQIRISFKSIGKALTLQSLDLTASGLKSLQGIGDAPSLVDLHIEQNNFTGSIPYQLYDVRRLEQVRLDDNAFTGSISREIGRLKYLQVFSADNNKLTGNLPDEIKYCTQLNNLRLKSNKLEGRLPPLLESITTLSFLDLSYNDFDGPLLSFSTHLGLRRLDLSHNRLTGTIPTNFLSGVDKEAFEFANLCSNKFKGQFPGSLAGYHDLYFEDNELTSLDPALYAASLGGAISEFGSDAVLCPPQKYNTLGRQQSYDDPCLDCPGVLYYGSTKCPTNTNTAVGNENVVTIPSIPPSVARIPLPVPLTPSPFISTPKSEVDTSSSTTSVPGSTGTTPPLIPITDDTPQEIILLNFYNACKGKYWIKDDNWGTTDDFCKWHGISCKLNEKSVERFEMVANNIDGYLDLIDWMKYLPDLKVLNLANNPMTIVVNKNSPTNVISNIEELNLNHIDLEDQFRHFFSKISFPELRELYMVNCFMGGEFPFFSRFMLPKIQKLDFSDNSFHDIPSSIETQAQLEYLSLSHNFMRGNIPEKIGVKLPALRFLYLGGNHLRGDIPKSLERLTNLEILDLGRQVFEGDCKNGYGFTGSLPAFETLLNLRRIDVSFNCLEGTIPANFLSGSDLSNIESVTLYGNKLSGTLPALPIFVQVSEDKFDLTDNRFSGIEPQICDGKTFGCNSILCPIGTYTGDGYQDDADIPCIPCPENLYMGSTFCEEVQLEKGSGSTSSSMTLIPKNRPPLLSELEILRIFYSSTKGDEWTHKDGWYTDTDYCTWYGLKCDAKHHVESIVLISNNLIGTVVTEIYSLPSLTALTLSENKIKMSFDGIEFARHLRSLDLSSTGLSDLEGLDEIYRLTELNIENNLFEGKVPYEVMHLTSLEQLRIGGNKFSGTIDEFIRNLKELKIFTADNNKLTGLLPDSMREMDMLHTLRLNSNKFSGSLPSFLSDMDSMTFLDLSYNNISGSLLPFDNHPELRSLDLSFNRLTGSIPVTFLAKVDKETFSYLNLQSNLISGELPQCMAGFHPMRLQDNQISAISPAVYDSVSEGELKEYGANAVLCPPKTYNSLGRQNSMDNPCVECPENLFFGSTTCSSLLVDSGTGNSISDKINDSSNENVPDNADGTSNDNVPFTDDGTGNGNKESVDKFTNTPVIDEGAEKNIDGSNSLIADNVYDPSINQPYDILKFFYQSTLGEQWTQQKGWLQYPDICTWEGIRCNDQNNVEEINLRSNNLRGIIPQNLYDLTDLTSLNLDGNEVVMIFNGIERATKLKTLDLSHTATSNLAGLEKAADLNDLYLTSNNLRRTFPTEVLSLKSLKRLSLAMNAFTGTIPSEISSLTYLEFLALHHNNFRGNIPAAIGKMENLLFLQLQSNELNGQLPPELLELNKIWFIDLSEQMGENGIGLTGTLPDFAGFTAIRRLDLKRNSFSGNIPDNLLKNVNPVTFEFVDLSANKLSGKVPSSLSHLPIDGIFLEDNAFTEIDSDLCNPEIGGSVKKFGCDAILCPIGTFNEDGRQKDSDAPCLACPESMYLGATDCISLSAAPTPALPFKTLAPQQKEAVDDKTILMKFFNSCGGDKWKRNDNWGDITTSHCNWFGIRCAGSGRNHVHTIALSKNNVVGTPPSDLFKLHLLNTLALDSNDIIFDFTDIDYAKKLQFLDLSQTGLVSLDGVEKAHGLKELTLDNNKLNGPFPTNILHFRNIEQLSLNHNGITGTLPSELGRLKTLEVLSVTSNQLTGQIPRSLGNLQKLATLHLQFNTLSGSLPQTFKNLNNLYYLDLSQQIQNGKGGIRGYLFPFNTMTNLRRLDLSHNLLSGKIPINFLRRVNPHTFDYLDLSNNKLSGKVPKLFRKFENSKVEYHLNNNEFTGIQKVLCSTNKYNCDGVLCPPQKFNSHGRQENAKDKCLSCPSSKFYGASSCDGGNSLEGGNTKKKHKPVKTKSTTSDGLSSVSTSSSSTKPPRNHPTASDREILTQLYEVCRGAFWYRRENWTETGSICLWEGVKCIKGAQSVRSLSLASNNVKCRPPTTIFRLPNLVELILYNNPLTGFDFSHIKEAKNLETLLLDATGISSLTGIEKATNLKKLNVRYNQLKGNLPVELKNLKTLEYLSLSNNMFEGPLPDIFEEMENLEILLLESNRFSGHLDTFTLPKNLKLVDLSDNEFDGAVEPSFLSNIPSHEQLEIDLSDNMLTGVVPSSFSRFERINLLLKGNFINGIAPELCVKTLWNEGDVGVYGCDGLLCPSQYWAPLGRSTKSDICQHCHSTNYFGSAMCADMAGAKFWTRSSVGRRVGIKLRFVYTILTCTLLLNLL